MMIDWTNIRTYPVWMHRASHERRQRIAHGLLATLIAIAVLTAVTVRIEHRTPAISAPITAEIHQECLADEPNP